MQPTHRPTAAVVVDAAAAAVPERPTEESHRRAGSVGGAATTCHFPGTFMVDPAIASAPAKRSVGPYRVDVGAD